MQNNLYLCKLNPTRVHAHLLLNEQINQSIEKELYRKGIRINDINGKMLHDIITKERVMKVKHTRDSEFNPFYYQENELDPRLASALKSNQWKLHVNFHRNYEGQEEKYNYIVEQLSSLIFILYSKLLPTKIYN